MIKPRLVNPVTGEGVAAIDLDGTLYPFASIDPLVEPHPGAVAWMQGLREEGWYIVIHTSRMSNTWGNREEGRGLDAEYATIERDLRRDGIPFDLITAEKVPAEFYLDDRAITFTGWFPVQGPDGKWRRPG